MKYNNVIPFRVDNVIFEKIKEHCNENNLKCSTFIRDIVVDYFRNKEDKNNG